MRALALAALLAAPAAAASPSCPPPGSGGQSTNWGKDFDAYVEEAFGVVRPAAGVDQDVILIAVNKLRPQNRSLRMVNGTPLGAVPKGTEGLAADGVFYTFGVFELACDQAQLGFFMAHEMRHLKRGPDGKNHFDRVNDCVNGLWRAWKAGTDLSAYPDQPAAEAAFRKAKEGDIAARCVRPVEDEADAFAFDLAPKLPWKVADARDPGRDARVQAFKNAERWLDALGERQDDPGHGTAADRAAKAYGKALVESLARQKTAEEKALRSLPR
ncbi:MAG: hypothetical protein HY079_06910 [Elusimicrobia bacterium]|nr:hypothetical protein [Elusimicrobiota bacterium]